VCSSLASHVYSSFLQVVYTASIMSAYPRIGSLAGLIERKHLAVLLLKKAFHTGEHVAWRSCHRSLSSGTILKACAASCVAPRFTSDLPSCPFRAEEQGTAPGTLAAYSLSLEGVHLPASSSHSSQAPMRREGSMAQVRRADACVSLGRRHCFSQVCLHSFLLLSPSCVHVRVSGATLLCF
jgi:hypothetical protein